MYVAIGQNSSVLSKKYCHFEYCKDNGMRLGYYPWTAQLVRGQTAGQEVKGFNIFSNQGCAACIICMCSIPCLSSDDCIIGQFQVASILTVQFQKISTSHNEGFCFAPPSPRKFQFCFILCF